MWAVLDSVFVKCTNDALIQIQIQIQIPTLVNALGKASKWQRALEMLAAMQHWICNQTLATARDSSSIKFQSSSCTCLVAEQRLGVSSARAVLGSVFGHCSEVRRCGLFWVPFLCIARSFVGVGCFGFRYVPFLCIARAFVGVGMCGLFWVRRPLK